MKMKTFMTRQFRDSFGTEIVKQTFICVCVFFHGCNSCSLKYKLQVFKKKEKENPI